jgi:3'(2'), 5'-bisphosphate nucleotidase
MTFEAPAPFDYEQACAALLPAFIKAGACIMRHFHGGTQIERKADNSPVTQADLEAEAILLAALRDLAPDLPVLSEESAPVPDRHPGRRFFLVDPLDGTKEFTNKRNDFTVNVGLIDETEPIFGMVYAPAQSRIAFTRDRGRAVAADLDPLARPEPLSALACRRLRVRPSPPEGLVAVVSASHLDPDTEAYLEGLPVAARLSAGSSLKFIKLAEGEADVYPRFGPTMEWDTAAGQAVLMAAGGRVVTADGAPLRYGKFDRTLKNPSFIAWGAS